MVEPLLILGPCSAESEEQLLLTAQALRRFSPDFFRAGLWKPRTKPDSFEGVGDAGLQWLRHVEQETGLRPMTEVATKEHLEQCLRSGITAFWIGARTTTNPILVQQLADVVSQSGAKGIVVAIKNPVAADIELWSGAVERFRKAGIEHILLVHRGFTPNPQMPTALRNDPQWQIPMEMHCRYPQYPLLIDSSHLAGMAEWVEKITLDAQKLCFDGMMLEVHTDPANALSDSQQQLTPDEFAFILDKWHSARQTAEVVDPRLQLLREQIDETDEALWQLILRRQQIARQIGEIKREQHLSIFQPQRYEQQLQQRLQWAEQQQLNTQLVKQIMQTLHQAAVQTQL